MQFKLTQNKFNQQGTWHGLLRFWDCLKKGLN